MQSHLRGNNACALPNHRVQTTYPRNASGQHMHMYNQVGSRDQGRGVSMEYPARESPQPRGSVKSNFLVCIGPMLSFVTGQLHQWRMHEDRR